MNTRAEGPLSRTQALLWGTGCMVACGVTGAAIDRLQAGQNHGTSGVLGILVGVTVLNYLEETARPGGTRWSRLAGIVVFSFILLRFVIKT